MEHRFTIPSIPTISIPPISIPSIPVPEDLIKGMQEAIKKKDYDFQCKRHALFMSTWDSWTIVVFVFTFIGGIVLINLANKLVDEERKDKYWWARWYQSTWNTNVKSFAPPMVPEAAGGDVLSEEYGVGGGGGDVCAAVTVTRIPATEEGDLKGDGGEGESERERENESLGLPPPYEPSISNEASTSTSPPQALVCSPASTPITKSTSNVKRPAEQFVRGTFVFSLLILNLFFQALAIQWFVYCSDGHRDKKKISNGWVIFWWSLCSPLYLGAFSSFLCWVILFRDLWGPGARKKLPIDPHFAWMSLGGFLIAAIALPTSIVTGGYKGLVWFVEKCQKGFCGGAVEEEGEELENMEGGRRMVGGEGSEEIGADRSRGRNRHTGEEAEEDETVGLMNGTKV